VKFSNLFPQLKRNPLKEALNKAWFPIFSFLLSGNAPAAAEHL